MPLEITLWALCFCASTSVFSSWIPKGCLPLLLCFPIFCLDSGTIGGPTNFLTSHLPLCRSIFLPLLFTLGSGLVEGPTSSLDPPSPHHHSISLFLLSSLGFGPVEGSTRSSAFVLLLATWFSSFSSFLSCSTQSKFGPPLPHHRLILPLSLSSPSMLVLMDQIWRFCSWVSNLGDGFGCWIYVCLVLDLCGLSFFDAIRDLVVIGLSVGFYYWLR